MGLPPRAFGSRYRTVRLETVEVQRWRVTIDGALLPALFVSEREAREAAEAEVVRLDGISRALVRHIQTRAARKR